MDHFGSGAASNRLQPSFNGMISSRSPWKNSSGARMLAILLFVSKPRNTRGPQIPISKSALKAGTWITHCIPSSWCDARHCCGPRRRSAAAMLCSVGLVLISKFFEAEDDLLKGLEVRDLVQGRSLELRQQRLDCAGVKRFGNS